MTRSRRIEPVVRVAARREQDAARAMAQQQTLLGQQEARLVELRGYREEYARRLRERGGAGVHAAALQDYRAFLDRLDVAIHQQTVAVERQLAQVEASRRQWLEQRVKSQAMGKAVDRFRADEAREADRREQQENDEYARRGLERRRDH